MHPFHPVATLSAIRRLPMAALAASLTLLFAAAPPQAQAQAQAQGSGETAGSGSSGQRLQRRLVMIQTDDDTAIREVEMDGKPMQVRRRAQARVFVEVEGNADNDGQIDCRRSLRLVLADGRILRDTVDICGDWKVTMATSGPAAQQADASRGVRQAVPSGEGPGAPPRAGGIRRPSVNGQQDGEQRDGELRGSRDETRQESRRESIDADAAAAQEARPEPRSESEAQPQAGAAPETTARTEALPLQDLPLFEGRKWYVEEGGGDRPQLVYGLPETDDRALRASCRRGSNRIDLQLAATGDPLAENQPVVVDLAARDVRRSYTARGSSANTESGQSEPVLTLAADDPIWTGMIRGDMLSVGVSGTWRYRVSLSGSAQPVRAFQQACATPAPVATLPPAEPLPGASGAGGLSCREEGEITSLPSSQPARMIFVNERNRPVVVHWLDFAGLRQTQAGIPPGGRMIQDTLAGHPWLVSTQDGRCLGIYVAGGGSRTVMIGRGGGMPAPGPVFPPAPPPQVLPLPPAPLPPEPLPSGDLLSLSYDCDSGTYLDVTIDNGRGTATVRERGLSPVTLADRSGGGGDLNYAGRGYALSGTGNTVTWQRPGAAPQFCRIF